MHLYQLIAFFLLSSFFSTSSFGQSGKVSSNPSQVNVNELTDDQILRIIAEIEKRGMSESDAIAMAKMRGMTQRQIDQLKKRMEETKKKGALKSHTTINGFGKKDEVKLSDEDDVFSRKVVIDSVKLDERIYGFALFNNDKLSFEPSVNIPVSQGYILGAGDELVIDVWGLSEQSYQLKVDVSGIVHIPLVGPVRVGGITLGEATSLIRSKLSGIYGDLKSGSPRTFMSVRTGELNPIRVNVIGEAYAPGTYTLPGTASLFNVLYLCGGPSPSGSFRDIQLIRAGKVIARLDVYDYLIKGNTAVNVPLADDDVVLVPTYINRVSLDGEFKRKGIFEGKEGETVKEILEYAGGFTEKANQRRVELYRMNGFEREFRDVTPENIASIMVANGDSLYAGKIIDRFFNMVTIKGAVFMPGNYEYTEGLSLVDLIGRSGGLTENAFMNRGFIERLKSNYTKENIAFDVADVVSGGQSIALQRGDVVFLNTIDDMRETQTVVVNGMVQEPGTYPFVENMNLGDLILLSGGFSESASGASVEVLRKLSYDEAETSTNSTAKLFSFSVSRQLDITDAGANFVLQPFDQVAIRKMPGYRPSGSATIEGQVYYAGTYGLSSYTDRVSDLVKRAGGVMPNAYLPGAKLVRKLKFTKVEIEARKELMRKDSLLSLGNFENEVISIDLVNIMKKPGGSDDIFVEVEDRIIIPGFLSTVKISGQVLNPSSTAFVDGISAREYVRGSGGFANSARRGRIYVIYPNGSSASTRSFLFFRSYPKVLPGSEVVVPRRPQREGMSPQMWLGIGSTMASIGLTVATIVSLRK